MLRARPAATAQEPIVAITSVRGKTTARRSDEHDVVRATRSDGTPCFALAREASPRPLLPLALLWSLRDGHLISTGRNRQPRLDTGTGTVPMEPTSSSVQIDPQDGVELAPLETKNRFTGVEDALSRLAQRAAREIPDPPTPAEGSDVAVGPPLAELSAAATASTASAGPQAAEPSVRATAADVFAGPQIGEPSALATVRPAEFRQATFPSEKPSPSRRAMRAVTGFLIAVGVGVAGSLAWQSYGSAAREMIANRIPQLAWISSRALTNQTPGPAAEPAIEASVPEPAAAQAARDAQAATDTPQATAAQIAPVAQTESSDHQQLDAMAREIDTLRQSLEQLVARQEQMARDMAKLQAAETPRHRVSAAPPRAAAAPPRRPLPPQAAPPVLSSSVTELPQPAAPPQP